MPMPGFNAGSRHSRSAPKRRESERRRFARHSTASHMMPPSSNVIVINPNSPKRSGTTSTVRRPRAVFGTEPRLWMRIATHWNASKNILVSTRKSWLLSGGSRAATVAFGAIWISFARWRRLPMTADAAHFFEEQLIAALKIIEAGDVNPRTMTGSWGRRDGAHTIHPHQLSGLRGGLYR